MLVQCPNCKITYKVSDDVIKGANPAFRCSRCKHTFELQAPDTSPPATEEPAADRPSIANDFEDREPKLAFPSPADTDKLPEQPELPELDAKPQFPAASHDRDEPRPTPVPAHQEEPFIIDTAAVRSQSAPAPQAGGATTLAPESAGIQFPKPEDLLDNVLAIEPYRDQQASTVPFLTLFGLLVVLFSFAAAYYQAHPSASEGMIGKIPLVGSSVLKNNHLHVGVLLKSLQGSFQLIQGNREVFMVSGTAINQNPVVIRKVRLAGQIFSAEGKELEQQSMWIGNALSPKIVHGMTVQDVIDLQKLEPLRNFTPIKDLTVEMTAFFGAIFATMDDDLREGQIVGTVRQVTDRMGEYVAAGVNQVNVTVPPPVDWDALHVFVEGVMPAFRPRSA
jgi:predicted Zn finger-like uncharacterized protein